MLKSILIIVVAYFVIRAISAFTKSRSSSRSTNDQDTRMNSDTRKSSSQDGVIKDGEYIDYEEVKD